MYHSGYHGNIGCSQYIFIQNVILQGNLEPNICVKIAIRFSISPKIAVSHGNLGRLTDFSLQGAGCLGEEGWKICALQGG